MPVSKDCTPRNGHVFDNNMPKYTFIDLFAGCGGLSEGFYKQGFKALAHVEIDHWACETLRKRMAYYGYKNIDKEVIEYDITSDDILVRIEKAVNGRNVDVIIGGPPCQAYSTAGRVRDSKGMASDPRNFLFESYVNILEYFKPKFFVFENVTGLAAGGPKFFTATTLKDMGFDPSGEYYLGFELKSTNPITIEGCDLTAVNLRTKGNQSYRPYFITLKELFRK